MFGPSALNTDQVQEDRGGVGESSIRSDETGVYGTLGVITSVPSLSLRDMDRMVPPPALKYTK